ncbi:MAG: hypothetical protein WAS21_31120 [Geminicoccaceae bacterium]
MSSHSEALRKAIHNAEIEQRKRFEKEKGGIALHNKDTIKNYEILRNLFNNLGEFLKEMKIEVTYEDDDYRYGSLLKGIGLYRNVNSRVVKVIVDGENFYLFADDQQTPLLVSDFNKLIDLIGEKIAKFHVYYHNE